MQRSARRPPAMRTHRAADDGRRRDARELAMLEGQLTALARDIKSARAAMAPASGSVAEIMSSRPAAPPLALRGERVGVPGGREICIRSIEPGDAARLRVAFEQLTALTRYKWCLGALDHISDRQLRYLTRVDHADHEALVALDAVSGAGVGIARYVRDARDPRLAGVAVVVTDAWQRRGVGSALLERLAQSARAVGIERLTGSSIVGDRGAAALAAHAGAVTASCGRPGTTQWSLRLGDQSAPAASTTDRGRTNTLTASTRERPGTAAPRPHAADHRRVQAIHASITGHVRSRSKRPDVRPCRLGAPMQFAVQTPLNRGHGAEGVAKVVTGERTKRFRIDVIIRFDAGPQLGRLVGDA
jgi:GNAT superfamily N-acetyltransferase